MNGETSKPAVVGPAVVSQGGGSAPRRHAVMPHGFLNNTVLLNKLFEITRQLFDSYLSGCDADEYQFKWNLQAEPIEAVEQLPHSDDLMSFSVGFDPDHEVLKVEAVFRKAKNAADEGAAEDSNA